MPRFPSLRTLSALLVGTAILAAPTAAQSIPSPYRFIEKGQEGGFFVGYFDTDPGRFGFGPKSAYSAGIRYGLELAGPLGLEGVATFIPTERDIINPARAEGDRVVGDPAEVALLFVEARLRFALTGRRTWHGLQPFVFAGVGLGLDVRGNQQEDERILEGDRFDFGTKFLGSAGAGTRLLLGSRFVLRVDGALQLYQLKTPGGFQIPERELGTVPDSEWMSGKSISLGLAYLF
ncbi:MAG TPA: hypothetical protein VLA43_00330 [Longimicrobiales bacterium]|nr:hypothetical protein [Longimicrobiales bacterium]